MKIQINFKPVLATSLLLLTASQMNLVQAADNSSYNRVAPPNVQDNGAPLMQQPPAGQSYGYGPNNNLTPGYGQPYNQGGNPGRNYGRGYNSSPWGVSGPWDRGRGGNSMPWSGGRGGNGPSFSGPWDGGRGNSMPWDSGRGGNNMPWSNGGGNNGPSFSGPWNSGRGNGMSW